MKNYRTKSGSGSGQNIPATLYQCRELMTSHLKQSLPNMMDAVDDVLLEIAVKTTDSQERKRYFSVMHEIRLKRNDIERKCIENFVELFSENLRLGKGAANEPEGAKDIDTMPMINAVNKIRHNCQQVLMNLDKRMSSYLNIAHTDSSRNPLSPEIVCQAFYNASKLVDSETEIRLIIFKYFEKNISTLLNDVYLKIDNTIEISESNRKSEIRNQQTSVENNCVEDIKNVEDVSQLVTTEMQNLLRGKHVPDFVSDFLFKNWVKLLTKIYEKNGIRSNSWEHAIETVGDLVWSVGNISAKEDRDKFDKLWPGLILRLRNGINMISMSRREETDFISKLSKHRATLTMLGALSKSKSNDATLISPDKIEALKMKTKSAIVQPVAKEMGIDSTASENATMPSLRMYAGKPPLKDKPLVDNDGKDKDLDSIGSEDVTVPMFKPNALGQPFMAELLADNFNVEGFKSDKDKS